MHFIDKVQIQRTTSHIQKHIDILWIWLGVSNEKMKSGLQAR